MKKSKKDSCAIGSCGSGQGMCPGIALIIAIILSTSVQMLTKIDWLGVTIGILTAALLIFGVYPGGGRWPIKR